MYGIMISSDNVKQIRIKKTCIYMKYYYGRNGMQGGLFQAGRINERDK